MPIWRVFLLVLCCLFLGLSESYTQSLAPQLIGGSSGRVQQGQLQIRYSVGESVVQRAYAKGTDHSFTQGFQQPGLLVFTRQDDYPIALTLAPNPVLHNLTIRLRTSDAKVALLLQLLDQQGRVLLTQKVQPQADLDLDMSRYPAGLYFLRALRGQEIETTHKIIKQ